MKVLLILLLLACYEYTYSQDAPPCSAGSPSSAISSTKAKKRINRYRNHKNLRLEIFTGKKEIDTIPSYSRDVFVELLDSLTLPGKHYDGFRVYMATYPNSPAAPNTPDSGYSHVAPGQEDHFTLIYVPTRYGGEVNKQPVHNDDTNRCFIIKDNVLEKIDAPTPDGSFLSKWINKYRSQRMGFLAMDGNGYVNKGAFAFHKLRSFRETESIWYDIAQTSNGKDGLLDFIKCSNSHVDLITVNFAGYLLKSQDWSYKLTLIFELQSFTNAFNGGKSKELFVYYKAAATTKNSDTGKPCPPPTPCNGSALPINK